jgi:hypothetical protein
MKHSTTTILLGAALLFLGYLGGTVAIRSGTGQADAAPLWDAAKGVYVTGDAASLTFWKIEGDKIVNARRWSIDGEHVVEATMAPPAARGGGGGSCGGGSCGG